MMAQNTKRQKMVVVGAGPVGALAALYAAQRGHDVEVYELRSGASLSLAMWKLCDCQTPRIHLQRYFDPEG